MLDLQNKGEKLLLKMRLRIMKKEGLIVGSGFWIRLLSAAKTCLHTSRHYISDHYHIIFKSPHFNHRRIKQKNIEGTTKLYFASFADMVNYQKKVRIMAVAFHLSVAVVASGLILFQLFFTEKSSSGATYGWTQTDWSGGADGSAKAVHPGNQTGWTKYESAGPINTANGELKLQRN